MWEEGSKGSRANGRIPRRNGDRLYTTTYVQDATERWEQAGTAWQHLLFSPALNFSFAIDPQDFYSSFAVGLTSAIDGLD